MSSFEVYLQDQPLRAGTMAAYLKDVRCFECWERKLPKRQQRQQSFPARVDAFLSQRRLSAGARNRYLASLTHLQAYRELQAPSAQLGTFAMSDLRRGVRPPPKEHRALSADELQRLVQVAHERSRPMEQVRNASLLHVLATSGLKTPELCMLTLNEVRITDEEPSHLTLNRGGDLCVVELESQSQQWLGYWLSMRGVYAKTLQGSRYVWPVLSANRTKHVGDPLSEQGVRAILGRYARLAGIERKITPTQLLTSREQAPDRR